MEKLADIENIYKKEVEKLDKEFINNIKGQNDKKKILKLENDYKEDLLKIKARYEKSYNNFLKKHKSNLFESEKEKKEKKKGKKKKFIIEKISLKLTRWERFKISWAGFKFRFKIKFKNFKRKITPLFITRFLIRFKFKRKRFYYVVKQTIIKTFEKLKESTISLLKKLKKLSIKTYNYIIKISKKVLMWIKKILSKFSKKKDEKKGGENRPDIDIAEKIIKAGKEKKIN